MKLNYLKKVLCTYNISVDFNLGGSLTTFEMSVSNQREQTIIYM